MTVPLGFCQPQLGLDCTVHEPSALKGSSTANRRHPRRPSRRTHLRPAVFHIHAAATAARSQSESTDVQNTASATEQRNSWQVAASNIVSSFQRHRRENHLPLCRAFGVESLTRLRDPDVATVHHTLQDVFNCMCLSEGVYKVVDFGEERATEILGAILEGFPPGLVSLKRVEWSRPDSNHRCLLGEADGALYMAFMGTKQRRDLVTNAQVLQEAVWPEDLVPDSQDASQAVPAAHRGFLLRARQVPIEAMYEHACRQKRRLVLSGHSLGGAVALLCTLRLLRQLPPDAQPAIHCHVFACPAIGNEALALYVKKMGWERYFSNMLIPEDAVPRILGGMQDGLNQSMGPSSYLDAGRQSMPVLEQGEAGTQWRRPRLLRLPGRSLIRVPLPGTPANSGPQQTGSRPSPLLSELGASGAGSSMVPSDASSDLLNWEKQVGSWEEDSPRSTADLSAETADELEAHARQLAAEVSQQGSEWEPLTASMDDSGAGGDLIAGMGSDSTAELADPRPLSQNDGLSKGNGTSTEADAEAKTLVPMWPLSLYPLSYRQDYSDADPQRTAGPSSAAEDALGEPISEPDLNSRPREKGGNQQQEMDASGVSKDSLGGNGAVADAVASLRSNASQPWQDESLPSSVSDDYTAAEQVSLQSEASTSALWRSRMSQAPDAAEKAVELAVSRVASPERPREPSKRLQSMRQTAAKAGSMVLGAGRASAKMGVGLASFSMKRAASFASVPFRVPIRAAQRRYFPIGRQLFLYPDVVTTSAPELGSNGSQRQMFEDPAAWCADRAPGQQSPADALPLDVRQLQNSALPIQERVALLAGATTPNAGRRPQPFVMHKMAFHRGRALGIIRRTLHSSLPANAEAQAESGGVLKDAIFDDVLALKQPSATWPRPVAVCAPNALGNVLRQRRLREGLLSTGIAPQLKARSAETWVEWALPGKEDVEQILDDLGSLSDPGRMAQTGSERWRWLQPWTWILGVWGNARLRADFVLDVTVRGRGLETCAGVQVQALGGVPCRAAVVRKPAPLPPRQVTALLHPSVPDALRTVSLLGAWAVGGVRWLVGAVDRQNATGTQDDLQVRVWVPAAVMRRAQATMVQGTGPGSSGLTLTVLSDFQESSVPLQIHAGGSAVVSDLQGATWTFLEWVKKNLDGEGL